MSDIRVESASLGKVEIPAAALWGPQTQRSLQDFTVGQALIPREVIAGYAILKRCAAVANQADGRLNERACDLIKNACDEIVADEHQDMFALYVWITGSVVDPAKMVKPYVSRV